MLLQSLPFGFLTDHLWFKEQGQILPFFKLGPIYFEFNNGDLEKQDVVSITRI